MREHRFLTLGIHQPGSNGAGTGYTTETVNRDLEKTGASIPEQLL